jgi:hypothetical protein
MTTAGTIQVGAPWRRYWDLALLFIIAATVWCTVFIRARDASFTHDESLSYLLYVHLPMGDLLAHKEAFTNNHMLNSIAMKGSSALFGSSELALRLPNLVGLAIYLIYGILLVWPLGPALSIPLLLLLGTDRGLMELFAMARGYGLACGFLLMGLYHLVQALRSGARAHVWAMHAAFILAVLSNFTVLTVALVASVLLPAIALFGPKGGSLRTGVLRTHLVAWPLAVLAVWEPVRRVVKMNEFDFGGSNGFITDTFTSLMFTSFPTLALEAQEITLLAWTAGVLVVLWAVHVGRSMMSATGEARFTMLVSQAPVIMLLGTLAAIIAQHIILATPYPVARFAKFLFPLLILGIGYGVHRAQGTGIKLTAGGLLMVWAGTMAFDMRTRFGPEDSQEWQYDLSTRQAMGVVAMDVQRRQLPRDSISIGHPWFFEPTINYYRLRMPAVGFTVAHRGGPRWDEDYLYLPDSLLQRVDTARYTLLADLPVSGMHLYRAGR